MLFTRFNFNYFTRNLTGSTPTSPNSWAPIWVLAGAFKRNRMILFCVRCNLVLYRLVNAEYRDLLTQSKWHRMSADASSSLVFSSTFVTCLKINHSSAFDSLTTFSVMPSSMWYEYGMLVYCQHIALVCLNHCVSIYS